MLWTVEGEDKETGAPWALDVEAVTIAEATGAAERDGMQVSRVHPKNTTKHTDSTSHRPPLEQPSLPGATTENDGDDSTPEYSGILLGAFVLYGLGILSIFTAIIVPIGISGNDTSRFMIFLSFASNGAIMIVLGSIGLAVRHIARNGFHHE